MLICNWEFLKHLTCLNKNRKLKCIPLTSVILDIYVIISQFWNWSMITLYFYPNTDEIFRFLLTSLHLPKRKELERYIMPLLVWNEKPTFLACQKLVEQCLKLQKISCNIFSPWNKYLPLAKVFKSLLSVRIIQNMYW